MSPIRHLEGSLRPCRCLRDDCQAEWLAHIREQVASFRPGQVVVDEFGRSATITEILVLDYPGPPIRARMALGINGSEAVGLFYPDRLRRSEAA